MVLNGIVNATITSRVKVYKKKKKKRTDKYLQNKNKLLRKFLFPSGSDTLVNLQINVLYQHSVF